MGRLESDPLWGVLRELRKNTGVHRPDIYEVLSSELRMLWGIESDNPAHASAIVADKLSALISVCILDSKTQLSARVAYNLVPEIPDYDEDGKRRGLIARFDWACTNPSFKIRPYSHSDTNLKFREDSGILDCLVAALRQQIPQASAQQHQPDSFYIPRPDLEARFVSCVKAGAQLIIFHGFPGMGKTSLARACVATLNSVVSEIFMDGGRIYTDSLRRALEDCGIDAPESLAHCEYEFWTKLLSSPQHPEFLLIDNLESSDQLAKLLLPGIKTRIIATCRARGEQYLPNTQFITVGRMDDIEAEQMIRGRLPSLSQRQVGYLASELQGYPLVIRHACTLLVYQDISLYEFIKGIRADAAEIACHARTEDNSLLLSVLRRLVSLVRQRDEFAYDLLTFISLVTTTSTIDARVLSHYGEWAWDDKKYRRPGTPFISINPLRYAQAVATLRDFGVIDQVLKSSLWTMLRKAETYTIHPLSQRMLRKLLQIERSRVVTKSVTLIVSLFKNLGARWQSLQGVDRENEFWLVILTVAEFLAYMLVDVAPRGEKIPAFFAKYEWIEPIAAVALLILISDTVGSNPTVVADHIPIHWYEWAKTTVYRHREFYEEDEGGFQEVLDMLSEIDAKRRAIGAGDQAP